MKEPELWENFQLKSYDTNGSCFTDIATSIVIEEQRI